LFLCLLFDSSADIEEFWAVDGFRTTGSISIGPPMCSNTSSMATSSKGAWEAEGSSMEVEAEASSDGVSVMIVDIFERYDRITCGREALLTLGRKCLPVQ
jgi:hypothetical protein